jgi:hypothetical protein
MSLYGGDVVSNVVSSDSSGKRFIWQIDGTESAKIEQDGNVYFNGGENITTTAGNTNLQVLTTNSQGADLGGSIGMGGVYHATNQITFAEIHGKKENGTTANLKGYMSFVTRDAGGSTEKMRITSDGNVGIGTDDTGNRRLKVHGTSGDISTEISTDATSNAFLRFSTDLDGTHRSGIIGIDYSDNVFKMNHGGSFDGVLNGLAINAAGNVGIGETNPTRKLHIKDNGQIKLESTSTGGWIGLDFAAGNGSYDGYMGILDSNGRFFIDVDSNGEDLSILQNGNVGIGVTNPATPLQIYQSTNATAGDQKPTPVLTLSAHTNSDNEGPAIEFNSAWVNNGSYLASTINNGWGVAKIAGVYDDDQGNGGALSFYTNEGPSATSGATSSQLTEKMRIKPNGNVGIGTTGPNESLHIYRASGDASLRLHASTQQMRMDQNSIRTTTNSDFSVFTNNNSSQLYLKQNNGYVGIGTSNPNQRLDVQGVTRSYKMELQTSSSDATFLNIINQAGGVDSRIDLKTSANNGGDPFIFFDAGGSNMVVGNHWAGTTNNQLRMGTGGSVSSSSFKGMSIDGLGKIITGPAIHINEGRGGSGTYNISNSSETYNLMMPSFYGSGSINQTYRHAYNINTPFHTTLWQGGGGNTVFTTWSKIGAEHYKDIYIETYTLYYSDIKIKVITDGNANVSVWYAGATYNNNVYSARWRVYPLQACTIEMNPSSSQSAVYMVHQASGGQQASATDTATAGSGPSTW